jgi:hypothetical protein
MAEGYSALIVALVRSAIVRRLTGAAGLLARLFPPFSRTAGKARFLLGAPGFIGGASERAAVPGFDVITQAHEEVIPAPSAHVDTVQLGSQTVVAEVEV